MKNVVILAHPDSRSLNASLATAFIEGAKAAGAEVVMRDLYQMNFEPRLRREEAGRGGPIEIGDDVAVERGLIGDADAFIFVYPLWFYAPPAILVGYIDRVFGMGFGYGPVHGGGNIGLLTGRTLLTISTSGAPTEWMRREGSLEAVVSLFDAHFAEVCGLRLMERLHFGGVVPNIRPDAAQPFLEAARQAGQRLNTAA